MGKAKRVAVLVVVGAVEENTDVDVFVAVEEAISFSATVGSGSKANLTFGVNKLKVFLATRLCETRVHFFVASHSKFLQNDSSSKSRMHSDIAKAHRLSASSVSCSFI